MGITQEYYMLFWTNPGSNTLQNSSSIATYLPSHKPSKLIKQDMGYCWRSKDKLINNIFFCTLIHGCASVGQPAESYKYQLCANTRCSLEDLPGMYCMDGKREYRNSLLSAWLDTNVYNDKSLFVKCSYYFSKKKKHS